MRCFVACFLEQESAEKLAALLPDIPGVRAVPVQNLHVTLQFLGSLAEKRAGEVLDHVRRLGGRPTSAEVVQMTGFPKPSRARVVVARLAADPRLADWHAILERGWPTAENRRGFDAHVTLARSRGRAAALPELAAPGALEVRLLAPAAYVSETRAEGAVYRPLDEAV